MRFREMDDEVLKEEIKKLINKLVMSLGNKNITREEMIFIQDETYNFFKNSNDFEGSLQKIYNEIMTYYRQYLPFCYASIRTAYRVIREKDNH